MAVRARRFRERSAPDIWPGFVDALTTLLLAITFLLSVFMLAQFFLSQALTGRDHALTKLNKQVTDLTNLLALEHQANQESKLSIASLSGLLETANKDRDKLKAQIDQKTQDLAAVQSKVGSLHGDLENEQGLTASAQAQVDFLSRQLAELRAQLQKIAAMLDSSEAKDTASQAVIAGLGKRLNLALASKVEELAHYRSEFFGRLRKLLGNRRDIRVVGDRFVFQSEVLFQQGSADIGAAGQASLSTLADTLKSIASKIPQDIPWILRVDGHTDKTPIANSQYASNWELSTARAVAVVKFLIAHGIPPERLAATGFGEYQPIDTTGTPEGMAHNRRIEFKLTER